MALSALVSLNNFKGSLTNVEASACVAEALSFLGIENEVLPVGDGGAGTVQAVYQAFGGEFISAPASGPLQDKVHSTYLYLPTQNSVYIESSQVCGYQLTPHATKSTMKASSRGLGEILLQVSRDYKNLKHIYIGLGDSAISDVGVGMLSALGFRFYDGQGVELPATVTSLPLIKKFEKGFVPETKITVLCDVSNPLCGPTGSARVFSPQKGASPEEVSLIEKGMENIAALIGGDAGKKAHGGSAGGLAFGLSEFLGGELVPGATFLFDWIDFDSILAKHDLLITGEGRTDRQTLSGKAPKECFDRAKKLNKKLVILSGSLGEGYESLQDKNLLAVEASGMEPDAKTALYRKAMEIFERYVYSQRQADWTRKTISVKLLV